MPRALPLITVILVVAAVLTAIAASTTGTLQHVLLVVAIPVLATLGTPVALGKIRRRSRVGQLSLSAHHRS